MQTEKRKMKNAALIQTEQDRESMYRNTLFTSVCLSLPQCLNKRSLALMETEGKPKAALMQTENTER
jgi:hypothetical protein